MKLMSLYRGALVVSVAAVLTACGSGSVFEPDTVDYKSAVQRPKLVIPPDLTPLENNENFKVPGTAIDYTSYMTQTGAENSIGFSNSVGDVSLQRDGDKYWLSVERSSEEIWSSLEAFWQDLGFILVIDEPKLGLLETDWAENRANIPQDFIRRGIGWIFDSVYSTGERDKYRTRVELTANGTEIFITHRGVEEVYSDREQVTTVWQPRLSNPELEVEMLRRLMVRLGVTEEQAKAAIETAESKSSRTQMLAGDEPILELSESLDTAWRWVGISLDRISFTVINRDRQAGVYHVRYIDPVADTVENEPGLFKGLFSGKKKPNIAHDYQIKLTASEQDASKTLIQVLSKDGAAVDVKIASRILGALAKDLR